MVLILLQQSVVYSTSYSLFVTCCWSNCDSFWVLLLMVWKSLIHSGKIWLVISYLLTMANDVARLFNKLHFQPTVILRVHMIVLSVCVISRSISWGVCKWFRMTFGHHHRSCYFDCCYSQRAKTENALSPAARTFVGYWVEYFVMYQVTTCCSKWSRLQTTCLHPALSLLHLLAAVTEISLHFFFSHFFQMFVCRVWPSCVHCSTCLIMLS